MSKPINSIADLTPDPRNARRHNPRNIKMIQDSLHEVGAARSIVIDENGMILAGNGVTEAANLAGIEKIQVVDSDGETIIAVRRSGLTTKQKKRLALADNRTSETSDWDADVLAELAAQEDELLKGLFEDDELAQLLAANETPKVETADVGELIDKAAELQKKWQAQKGDMWQCGAHRLMCGDSTNAEDVAKLMQGEKAKLFATDPPYGIDYDSAALHRNGSHFDAIEQDDLKDEKYQAWLELGFSVWKNHLTDDAAWYLWHPMLTQGYFAAAAAAAAAGVIISRQIIWRKPQFIFGRGDYHWMHELCFYGWRKGHKPRFYGERNQTTIWEIGYNGERNKRDHPTAKPPELWYAPMNNHLKAGELCAEPFSGSGAQLVAGEQRGRIVYAMESKEKYVSVALERMSLLGLEPKRI